MDISSFKAGLSASSITLLFDRFLSSLSFVVKEAGLILGVDDDINKLERTLGKMQALVDFIDSMGNVSNNALQIWVRDIICLSTEGDNLLDDVSSQLLKLKSHESIRSRNENQLRDKVISSLKVWLPGVVNELQEKLENVITEMDTPLIAQMLKFGQSKSMVKSPTSSLVNISSVIGRNRDKEIIVEMLCGHPDDDLVYVSICGIGGIGKTTLAQVVYNDPAVVQHFDLRTWISVPLEFDIVNMTNSVLESLTGDISASTNLDLMQLKLKNLLNGKRFLLVLDDTWDDRTSDWDTFRLPFVGSTGSKILLTSRNMIPDTFHCHCLSPLSDEDCWNIIKQKAFLNRENANHEVFSVFGKKIAKKCHGISLAAKTLGNVLYFKDNKMQWEAMMKSELWDIPEDKNEVFSSLKLSYDRLPSHLKRCFAYCSNFPLNHKFKRDTLVNMWIAEGFVQTNDVRRIEDVGQEYFDDLVWRCFFHISSHDLLGRPIYTMHNLNHHLTTIVCLDTTLKEEMPSLLPMFKNHLDSSFLCKERDQGKVFSRYKFARTVILREYSEKITQVPCMFFEHFKSLRVLDLSFTGISGLSNSVEYLSHLRFLDVSDTNISVLPESIECLYWLQTLNLNNCTSIKSLPVSTKNLTQLRHLDFDVKKQLTSMPSEFGNLTNLQHLSAFIVGQEKGHRVEELMNMNQLHGSLCIKNLDLVANIHEAKKARLEDKVCLQKLELEWDSAVHSGEEEVLAGLQPHFKIQELSLQQYYGFMFPDWLGNPLFCELKSITLTRCDSCTIFPNLGGLPNLKYLYVSWMNNIEFWDLNVYRNSQSSQFPSLELLSLSGMAKLGRWGGMHIVDMPRLNHIYINDCPNLVALPSLHHMPIITIEIDTSGLQSFPMEGFPRSLISLEIVNCDDLREQCMVEGGEEWSKIINIPIVNIDGQRVLLLSSNDQEN